MDLLNKFAFNAAKSSIAGKDPRPSLSGTNVETTTPDPVNRKRRAAPPAFLSKTKSNKVGKFHPADAVAAGRKFEQIGGDNSAGPVVEGEQPDNMPAVTKENSAGDGTFLGQFSFQRNTSSISARLAMKEDCIKLYPPEEEDSDEMAGQKKTASKQKKKVNGKKKSQGPAFLSKSVKSQEILCKICRKADQAGASVSKQQSLSGFFSRRATPQPMPSSSSSPPATTPPSPSSPRSSSPSSPSSSSSSSSSSSPSSSLPPSSSPSPSSISVQALPCVQETATSSGVAELAWKAEAVLLCKRCRRPMEEKKPQGSSKLKLIHPMIERLRGYQRTAKDSEVDFTLTDAQAMQMMRAPCSICGDTPNPEVGHGITRLRKSDLSNTGMGPYSRDNTATACAVCNISKGFNTRRAFVEICRHIATYRALSEDGDGAGFGLYDHRFRNNVSERSRSSYLTESKTFALTTDQFKQIVAKPCFYCGKESNPPEHYNGLDRLDSTVRVYTTSSCVSCCGTCNTTKYRLTLDQFMSLVKRVAEFHRDKPLDNF